MPAKAKTQSSKTASEYLKAAWPASYVVLNPRGTVPETDLANNRRSALVKVMDI